MTDSTLKIDNELNVAFDEKGNGTISAADIKAAAKRADLDIDEVKNMQKRVNAFIGDVAVTAGQAAVDYMTENPEVSKLVTSFKVGEISPQLTVRQSAEETDFKSKDGSKRVVYGQTRLDMKKSMPTDFRKSIQHHIQDYAEPKLSAELKAKA